MGEALGSVRAQLGNLELLILQACLIPLGGHSCPHCDLKLLSVFFLQGAPSGLFYLCLDEADPDRHFPGLGCNFP